MGKEQHKLRELFLRTYTQKNLGNFERVLFYLITYSLQCVKIWITDQRMFVTFIHKTQFVFRQIEITFGFPSATLGRRFELRSRWTSLKATTKHRVNTLHSLSAERLVHRFDSSGVWLVYSLSVFRADSEKSRPYRIGISKILRILFPSTNSFRISSYFMGMAIVSDIF